MDWLNDMAEWIEGTDDEIADIVEDVEEIDVRIVTQKFFMRA